MPWVPLDDGFYSHRKVIAAGLEAVGLHCRALSWCGANLTDGFIPAAVAREFAGSRTRKLTQQLVAVGLWQAVTDGWRIHGWTERNPPSDVVRARRQVAADRQRRRRGRSNVEQPPDDPATVTPSVTRDVTRDSHGTSHVTSHVSHADPSPSPSPWLLKSGPVPLGDARATRTDGQIPGQTLFGAVRAARERAGFDTKKWTDNALGIALKTAQKTRPELTRTQLETALLTVAVWADTDVPGRLRHVVDKALREVTHSNGQPLPPLPPTVAERRARGDLGNA